MDKSEQYIKQCEKAEEILPHHDIEPEDFLGNSPTRKESVWLPRQDQLQEMFQLKWGGKDELWETDNITKIIYGFANFAYHALYRISDGNTDEELYPYHQFTSMEQLWLAFVMKEKFNKSWDGKDWIKEN